MMIMVVLMAMIPVHTLMSIRRSCNRPHGCHRCHSPKHRWLPCIQQHCQLRQQLTFQPSPLSPPSEEQDWRACPVLPPSRRHHLVPMRRRKYRPGKFCQSCPSLSPDLRRGTALDLLECQICDHQASFGKTGSMKHFILRKNLIPPIDEFMATPTPQRPLLALNEKSIVGYRSTFERFFPPAWPPPRHIGFHDC